MEQPQQATSGAEPNAQEQASPANGKRKAAVAVREAVHGVVGASKTATHRVGDTIKKPATGAAIAGAAGVGSAVLFGLAPTAVGAAAGYVVYRMLKKRRAES